MSGVKIGLFFNGVIYAHSHPDIDFSDATDWHIYYNGPQKIANYVVHKCLIIPCNKLLHVDTFKTIFIFRIMHEYRLVLFYYREFLRVYEAGL